MTEKIYDALAAGCVPIYLGAPNIQVRPGTSLEINHIQKLCIREKQYYVWIRCFEMPGLIRRPYSLSADFLAACVIAGHSYSPQ